MHGVDEETLEELGGDTKGALFVRALGYDRRGYFGPGSEGDQAKMLGNFKKTMKELLSDPETQARLKSGKVKLLFENLWGSNPERGFWGGVPFYDKPENMAKANLLPF